MDRRTLSVLLAAVALAALCIWLLLGRDDDAPEPRYAEPLPDPAPERMLEGEPDAKPAPVHPIVEPEPVAKKPDVELRDPLDPNEPPKDPPVVVAEDDPKKKKDTGTTGVVSGSGPRSPPNREPLDGNGGMVWIEPVHSMRFGAPKVDTIGRTNRMGERGPVNYQSEWPQHTKDLRKYAIDLYEVTNAQYHRYLTEAAQITYITDRNEWDYDTQTPVPPLVKIATVIVTELLPDGKEWVVPRGLEWYEVARQLYETNKDTLHRVYPALMQFDNKTEAFDPEATWEAFLNKELRNDIELRFYDRAPPGSWPESKYAPGMGAHPVRDITFEEAQAFAHWAGKHVPNEYEWEYAARGPAGLEFPWGRKSVGFADVVNGGTPLEEGAKPKTQHITTNVGGISWAGCFHMLGNVSEWTGSRFRPYPDWVQEFNLTRAPWAALEHVGRAMVIRGGSAADEYMELVSTTSRGYQRVTKAFEKYIKDTFGDERRLEYEPLPKRRLQWSGFRCALYEEPARSRLPEIEYLLTQANRVRYGDFDEDGYAGAEVSFAGGPGHAPEDGVYVLHAAHTFVSLPAKKPRYPTGATGAVPKIEDDESLLEAGATDTPLLLGLLQLDLEAYNLRTVRDLDPMQPPSRYLEEPLPGDVYVIAVLWKHLALLSPDLRTVYYLSAKPITGGNLKYLKPVKTAVFPKSNIEVRPQQNDVRVELFVPLDKEEEDGPQAQIRVRFHLEIERNLLRRIGEWQLHRSR